MKTIKRWHHQMTQSKTYNELKPLFCKSHDANFPDSQLIHEDKVHDISKLKDTTFEKYKQLKELY